MTAPGIVVTGQTEIPVRNLWLLMIYASRLYQDHDQLSAGSVEENPDSLLDVVTDILATAVERRLLRGLGRRYVTRHAELPRVRGRIDLLSTERRGLLQRGQIACRFDELSVDDPRNRLLHTALVIAARHVVSPELERRCRILTTTLVQYGVSPRLITRQEASAVSLGRNDTLDIEAVHAARLILDMAVPAEDGAGRSGRAPVRDIDALRRLYEQAVRGFYRATLPTPWTVAPGERIYSWPAVDATPGLGSVLPRMRLDTLLERPDRRIVVETKFTDALKVGQYGMPRLNRNHVFQLYAYVQSQHGTDELSLITEGVLLYPTVNQALDESATIQGHRYRYLSVDLAGTTTQIRKCLLSVVGSSPVPPGP